MAQASLPLGGNLPRKVPQKSQKPPRKMVESQTGSPVSRTKELGLHSMPGSPKDSPKSGLQLPVVKHLDIPTAGTARSATHTEAPKKSTPQESKRALSERGFAGFPAIRPMTTTKTGKVSAAEIRARLESIFVDMIKTDDADKTKKIDGIKAAMKQFGPHDLELFSGLNKAGWAAFKNYVLSIKTPFPPNSLTPVELTRICFNIRFDARNGSDMLEGIRVFRRALFPASAATDTLRLSKDFLQRIDSLCETGIRKIGENMDALAQAKLQKRVYAYHNARHAAEMCLDTLRSGTLSAEDMKKLKMDAAEKLLSAVMALYHDVVQNLVAPNNEIESYKQFMADFRQAFGDTHLPDKFYASLDKLAYRTIVTGTYLYGGSKSEVELTQETRLFLLALQPRHTVLSATVDPVVDRGAFTLAHRDIIRCSQPAIVNAHARWLTPLLAHAGIAMPETKTGAAVSDADRVRISSNIQRGQNARLINEFGDVVSPEPSAQRPQNFEQLLKAVFDCVTDSSEAHVQEKLQALLDLPFTITRFGSQPVTEPVWQIVYTANIRDPFLNGKKAEGGWTVFEAVHGPGSADEHLGDVMHGGLENIVQYRKQETDRIEASAEPDKTALKRACALETLVAAACQDGRRPEFSTAGLGQRFAALVQGKLTDTKVVIS